MFRADRILFNFNYTCNISNSICNFITWGTARGLKNHGDASQTAEFHPADPTRNSILKLSRRNPIRVKFHPADPTRSSIPKLSRRNPTTKEKVSVEENQETKCTGQVSIEVFTYFFQIFGVLIKSRLVEILGDFSCDSAINIFLGNYSESTGTKYTKGRA